MKTLAIAFLLGLGTLTAHAADLKVDVQVSTAVANREALGVGTLFPKDIPQLAGWTRVRGASEPIEITHRWRRDGKDVARVKLPIRSSNYRAWSFCEIKGRTGAWALDVLDWDGNVLATYPFDIK